MKRSYEKPEVDVLVLISQEAIANETDEDIGTDGGHSEYDPWA